MKVLLLRCLVKTIEEKEFEMGTYDLSSFVKEEKNRRKNSFPIEKSVTICKTKIYIGMELARLVSLNNLNSVSAVYRSRVDLYIDKTNNKAVLDFGVNGEFQVSHINGKSFSEPLLEMLGKKPFVRQINNTTFELTEDPSRREDNK